MKNYISGLSKISSVAIYLMANDSALSWLIVCPKKSKVEWIAPVAFKGWTFIHFKSIQESERLPLLVFWREVGMDASEERIHGNYGDYYTRQIVKAMLSYNPNRGHHIFTVGIDVGTR